MVRGGRVAACPWATHSRQWKPTEAGVRHSGHAGRPQREQDSGVNRSGCQVQGAMGGPADAGPGADMLTGIALATPSAR
jgi:hypothetical protein